MIRSGTPGPADAVFFEGDEVAPANGACTAITVQTQQEST
jgi:hypothetical protein